MAKTPKASWRARPIASTAFLLSFVGLGGWLPLTAESQSPSPQKSAQWQAGLAAIKITPEQPLLMAGYAGRTKPFEKVAGDIYVKAMVLEDSDGHRGVLITCDLLGFPAEVTEPICDRLQKKTTLKREQILLNSSHTHSAPQLGVRSSSKGITGDDSRTMEYTRQLQDKVVEVVEKALEHLEPARLSWGVGVIDFAMNRREFTPSGVILGVNPRGLADRGVPVLRVDGADGQLRAILFGTAVHGTTLGPDNMQLCGDFAGFAQAALQEQYPTAQAMYMLGCAGDDNPYPRGTMELTRQHGQALAKEVVRVLGTKLRPVSGPLQIAFDRSDLPLQGPYSREQLQKMTAKKNSPQSFAATQMLAMLDRGEKLPTHYTCPLTVWQFGKDLTLVGLPGEVVVDYVTLLEKALGPNQLWLAAYCNDVFGYLPSARVLSEGGYETRGLYSGSAGLFDAKAEEVVVQKVSELARKVGRQKFGGSRMPVTTGSKPVVSNGMEFQLIADKQWEIQANRTEAWLEISLRITNRSERAQRVFLNHAWLSLRDADGKERLIIGGVKGLVPGPRWSDPLETDQDIELPFSVSLKRVNNKLDLECKSRFGMPWTSKALSAGEYKLTVIYRNAERKTETGLEVWTGDVEVSAEKIIIK
jgi:neutral ceramidase